MSTSKGPEVEYHCFSDCRQTGCPGHKTQFVYHHTSDIIRIEQDGTVVHYFDPDEWRAILRSYEAWRRGA